MSPLEAITLMIATADQELSLNSSLGTVEEELSDHERRLQLAVAVIQAMLNTALPVVRYRAHVSIDSFINTHTKYVTLEDFTVCGVTMGAIRNGLRSLQGEPVEIEVTVWEQKSTGADMLTGYRGSSKAPGYRTFLANLDELEKMPTVQ